MNVYMNVEEFLNKILGKLTQKLGYNHKVSNFGKFAITISS